MGIIFQFKAKGRVEERRAQQPTHSHGRQCLCTGCRNANAIVRDLRERPMPLSGDAIVKQYEFSLLKGLENWANDPKKPMFEAVTEQLIADGIVR